GLLGDFAGCGTDGEFAFVIATALIAVAHAYREVAANLAFQTDQNHVQPRRKIVLELLPFARVPAGCPYLLLTPVFVETRELSDRVIPLAGLAKFGEVKSENRGVPKNSLNWRKSAIALCGSVMVVAVAPASHQLLIAVVGYGGPHPQNRHPIKSWGYRCHGSAAPFRTSACNPLGREPFDGAFRIEIFVRDTVDAGGHGAFHQPLKWRREGCVEHKWPRIIRMGLETNSLQVVFGLDRINPLLFPGDARILRFQGS